MIEHSLQIQIDSPHSIDTFSFSADGRCLFVCSYYEAIQVLRVRDGRQITTMTASDFQCLAVSNDGRWIAVGTLWNVCLWDANSYKHVCTLQDQHIISVDFSPDSTRLVTASSKGTVSIWDLAARQRVVGPLRYPNPVIAAKFSLQGDRIATALQNSVRVYDSNNGHLLIDIPVTVTQRHKRGLIWSNSHLFIVSDNKIKQFNPSTGSPVSERHVPDTNSLSSIVPSQHGESIAYTSNRTLTFWDTSTHVQLDVIQHAQDISSIAFSPGGRFLAIAGEDKKIYIQSISKFTDWIPPHRLYTFRDPDILIDDAALCLWRNDRLLDVESLLTAAIFKPQEALHHALASRALVRTRLGQWDAAIDDANQSIEFEPSGVGYIAKSVALFGKGDKLTGYRVYDIAFQHLRSADVNFLLLMKAVIVFMAGEHDDGISRLEDLIATIPLNSICFIVQAYMYLLLGNSCMERSDYVGAIPLFDHARTRVQRHESRSLLVISLISGWKFEDLGITIRQRLCEALCAAGRMKEGGESLLEMVNTYEKDTYMSEPITKWVSEFTHRYLSCNTAFKANQHHEVTIDHVNLNPLMAMRVLRRWAKSTLSSRPWRDTLVAAVSFLVPRFAVYRALCERLEMMERVMDATECLQQMVEELDVGKNVYGEQMEWFLDFKECCAERLTRLGDAAADAGRYNDATTQYSAALSLRPVVPQDILMKRCKVHVAKKSWAEALDDTNQVIMLNPLSSFGYDDVLTEWARVELTNRSYRNVLTNADCFKAPRFAIYRVICERLEMTDHVMEAIECLEQMVGELPEGTDVHGEQKKWIFNFQQCCAEKLLRFADVAVHAKRYDDAILQCSAALSLDPAVPQDVLIRRSKVYLAQKSWVEALDDANKVAMLDPLSTFGYDNVLTEWAKVELPDAAWRNVLSTAGGFDLPKFTIYRALCEHLETMDRVMDAIECFHEVASELVQEPGGEQAKWILNFKSRGCGRLEGLGDTAMNAQKYDEAILLYSTALSLKPTVPRPLFGKRSKVYEARGLWEEALNDANEIITLDPSSPFGYERKYIALCGARDHKKALQAFDMMLLKMSESPDSDIRERCCQFIKTRQIIRTAIQSAIRGSPRVLINTTSGRLCNKSEQAAAFESLPVFGELIWSMMEDIDHVRIEQKVAEYYRYATLSHSWEDDEPPFDKVIHVVVYNLEQCHTHDKLQMFCKVVRDAGFHWAWSDTCCINKADHHVLQEALVLMFKWYEGSALTIVLLRGVRSPSQRGDLVRSIWNSRAWTLQEYHASKVIRFYNEDWTPYLNLDIPNHKESPAIISEMEEATGVSAHALKALRPGLDDIRDKLCLASTRKTTRVEDEAYSLFGIFSISLPIVYGEGDKALGKLLAQLLTSSGDASILAWTGRSGSFNSCLPVDIAVFTQLPKVHIPSTTCGTELDVITARLSASSLSLTLAMKLHDQLKELPTPFFLGQRMKLPCLAFKLGPVSTRGGCVSRAQTTALGIVEIVTKEDLSRLGSLYLIHPWLDVLLDRYPIGSMPETMLKENIEGNSFWTGDFSSFPDSSNIASAVPQTRAARFINRLGRPFGGRPNMTAGDVESLRPPSSVTQAERELEAIRLVARLRQPFGALLLAPIKQNAAEYRRVAVEDLIKVQVEEITLTTLNKLVNSVRVLDVL